MPFVESENVDNQQSIGGRVRHYRASDLPPPYHRQPEEGPRDAAGDPVSTVQETKNN